MLVGHIGLITAEKRRSQLNSACPQHQGRCNTASIGYAASSNDGNLDRINDLGQKRKQARLHFNVDAGKFPDGRLLQCPAQ